jgi:hypothetical protein
METTFPKKVPAIAMIKILESYAYANKIPFSRVNWKIIRKTFLEYNEEAKILN